LIFKDEDWSIFMHMAAEPVEQLDAQQAAQRAVSIKKQKRFFLEMP
jgi:hypothetical protein